MLRTFIFAEPGSPLKDWELKLLEDIYNYWPNPAKTMTDKTAKTIIHDMEEDGIYIRAKYAQSSDLVATIKEVYKKRTRGQFTKLQWDKRQWKTLDAMADHGQIEDMKKWFKKNPSYNINERGRDGTILDRQAKKQHNKVVAYLLSIPDILVTDTNIGDINENTLKNNMIRMKIGKEHSSRATQSESVSNESKAEVREECGHFSMPEDDVGICYLISVITLFRNERTLLNWLKSEERDGPLSEIIKMLDTDYSDYDFKKKCPNLPLSMRQAVTQNRTLRSSAKKNGGNAYTIMLYIMNFIDIWTELSVYTHTETVTDGTIPSNVLKKQKNIFESSTYEIGYVDITCDFEFSNETFDLLGMDSFVAPLKGFLMRLINPEEEFNHVVAGCVCDGQIHICNSWGKGCQTDIGQIVAELTDYGMRKLWIVNIGFFYSKLGT